MPDQDHNSMSWRILGFGRLPEVADEVERQLRAQGLQAHSLALTDDAEGDAALVRELHAAEYDGVEIGGFINGRTRRATHL